MIGVEVGACLQTSDLRAAQQRLILSQLRNVTRVNMTSCSSPVAICVDGSSTDADDLKEIFESNKI